jgi:hypothetical protein
MDVFNLFYFSPQVKNKLKINHAKTEGEYAFILETGAFANNYVLWKLCC